MSIKPLYFGPDSFECHPNLDVHPFFPANIVSGWSQLEFLASVSGSTHVNLSQAQTRTSQNTVLIKENCLDELQRDIIVGREVKLRTINLSAVRPSPEAPSAKQPNVQETRNTGQGKADDSGANMLPVHTLLFNHAAESVAMSCVLNTMSKRACQHFEEKDEEGLVETAKALSVVEGFEEYECTIITRKYSSILAEKGVAGLRKNLIIDRGAIHKEHADLEELPEISNIEFKRPGCTERDLALQNRKNVRLARCIQEAHVALRVEDALVMMADVAGFVGIFYQVKPMGDIAIAGETTSTMVHLPRSAGGLEAFLEDISHAIMWNFMVLRAKERHDVVLEKAKMANGVKMSSDTTHSASEKKFQNNMMLTPSQKRSWTGRIRIQISPNPLQDIRTLVPPSSPTEEVLKRRQR
ncbi:hypothetical protein KI688_007237 [Linnemannia hyalina]|uniref:Uncharacterized protein n=1 Tax=Linnemannia hyalina TaxID=64524 RepID=A0A9P7XIC2_9FUNG|nr:hypothetical protein KI688_007237 [Linnemannia hyalina]